MDLELEGRIAVVTGASVGIGRQVAITFSAEGASTAIVARRRDLLVGLADEIEAAGGKRPLVVVADLYEPDAPLRVRDEVFKQFGHADILVNNAGGSRSTHLYAPEEVWSESLAINFSCTRRMTQAFLPSMQQRKWGRIINLTGSMEPHEINAANAFKAATNAWSKGVSRMVGKDAITVNCLVPGRVHSEQIDKLLPTPEIQREYASANIPANYIGEPSDVANLVVFLCSERARYITGQRIHVDGGLHRAV